MKFVNILYVQKFIPVKRIFKILKFFLKILILFNQLHQLKYAL
jgi:hypothetical protein